MEGKQTKCELPKKAERHRLFGSVKPGPNIKPIKKNEMSDLQNVKKDFLFDLDVVGIAGVKHPITVHSNISPTNQKSIGTFQFSSSIDRRSKGTNMSRFTEQLNEYYTNSLEGFSTNIKSLKQFTKDLVSRLEQKDAKMEVSFPWFFERRAPYSKLSGMNHADLSISIDYDRVNNFTVYVSLSVLITTLCPCSKDISDYSAHNQRGRLKIESRLTNDFDELSTDWKEMLLNAAESNASAPMHPVLKRPDEKVITEQAYENPRFVEDIVRLVAADLYEMPFISKFKVTCRNEESIHMHDAIASITYDKQKTAY